MAGDNCHSVDPQLKGAVIPPRPVSVNTRLYKLIHGEEPAGVRSWGFTMGEYTGVFWVHGVAYAEARDKAIRRARRLQVEYVTVLP